MTVPAIYLVDDAAAGLRAELARHLAAPHAPRLETGPPDDASGVVLVGARFPLSSDDLRAAAGIVLFGSDLEEQDRVRMALAGREGARLEVLGDPAAELGAERALRLLLQLVHRRDAALGGAAVGLLGFRALGWRLAMLLQSFAATVQYWSPPVSAREREEQRKQALLTGARAVPFDELLRTSDALLVDLQDEPGEEPWIGRAELALMRDDVLVVNTTSATALDDGALIQSLRGGYLGGVALARTNLEPLPPDSPLFGFERVMLKPGDGDVGPEQARRLLAASVARALGRLPGLGLAPRRVRHVARRRPRGQGREEFDPKGRD